MYLICSNLSHLGVPFNILNLPEQCHANEILEVDTKVDKEHAHKNAYYPLTGIQNILSLVKMSHLYYVIQLGHFKRGRALWVDLCDLTLSPAVTLLQKSSAGVIL